MDQPAPPFITPTYEDKIAQLCEPVRLRSDYLPRFVLILLEAALHAYLCSFAACLRVLIEKYRQGTLEPWPDAPEAAMAPRRSKYTMKSHPAAPRRSLGATLVQISAEAVAELGLEVEHAAMGGKSAIFVQRPAWPRPGALGQRQALPRSALVARAWPPDRCRPAMFFRAAEMRRETCV